MKNLDEKFWAHVSEKMTEKEVIRKFISVGSCHVPPSLLETGLLINSIH